MLKRQGPTLAALVILLVGLPALGGDAPLSELERSLRELEAEVRSLHALRLAAAGDLERGRSAQARAVSEGRELEAEAASLEQEIAPARDGVTRLEAERAALEARRSKLAGARAALVTALDAAAVGSSAEPSVGRRVAALARTLEGEARRARTCEVEDGHVRIGRIGRLDAGTEPGRSLADQLTGKTAPALVLVPVRLERAP